MAQNKTTWFHAHCKLRQSQSVRLLFQTRPTCYLHMFNYFLIPTKATTTDAIQEEQRKADSMMNNLSDNVKRSNKYDLLVKM